MLALPYRPLPNPDGMTSQSSPLDPSAASNPGARVAQLRQVLDLVEEIAGRDHCATAGDAALDEAARISGAYDRAVPIVQRRFDALAAEADAWAAAGVEALLADDTRPPRAAAGQFADELATALAGMAATLRA